MNTWPSSSTPRQHPKSRHSLSSTCVSSKTSAPHVVGKGLWSKLLRLVRWASDFSSSNRSPLMGVPAEVLTAFQSLSKQMSWPSRCPLTFCRRFDYAFGVERHRLIAEGSVFLPSSFSTSSISSYSSPSLLGAIFFNNHASSRNSS